jgi:hypothetical protein
MAVMVTDLARMEATGLVLAQMGEAREEMGVVLVEVSQTIFLNTIL